MGYGDVVITLFLIEDPLEYLWMFLCSFGNSVFSDDLCNYYELYVQDPWGIQHEQSQDV
jgi:hypothetical protein